MERLNLLDKTTQHLSNGYVKLGTSQWTVYQNKASFEGCPDAIKQITDQNDPLNANFPRLSYHVCVNFKDCFIYGFTVYLAPFCPHNHHENFRAFLYKWLIQIFFTNHATM